MFRRCRFPSRNLHLLEDPVSFQTSMTREVFQKAMAQKPFRRFSIRLTDGRLVQIKDEHTAAVHPKGSTLIVFEEKGGYRIIDIMPALRG